MTQKNSNQGKAGNTGRKANEDTASTPDLDIAEDVEFHEAGKPGTTGKGAKARSSRITAKAADSVADLAEEMAHGGRNGGHHAGYGDAFSTNGFADEAEETLQDAHAGYNLDSIMRIPVSIQVVLGSASMPVANLMKLGRGAVVPLDHRVGEPVDVVVNGRVVARGEVVVVEDDNSRFGVSLTEIVSAQSGGVGF
jgi:flagellar motor switch protein FliN/FliY